MDEIAPDGTQFANEREPLPWGFVNTLHMQTVRLDRTVDKLSPQLKELQSSQDGSEIKAWELERVIERCRNLGAVPVTSSSARARVRIRERRLTPTAPRSARSLAAAAALRFHLRDRSPRRSVP